MASDCLEIYRGHQYIRKPPLSSASRPPAHETPPRGVNCMARRRAIMSPLEECHRAWTWTTRYVVARRYAAQCSKDVLTPCTSQYHVTCIRKKSSTSVCDLATSCMTEKAIELESSAAFEFGIHACLPPYSNTTQPA